LPSFNRFVIAVGDRQRDARIAVSRRAEDQAIFAYPQAPGVVVGRTQEFQLGRIGFETEKALLKRVGFSANGHGGIVIALHGPNPVVEAIAHVAHAAVSVALAPVAEQNLADVGFAFARFILEEHGSLSFEDNDAAVVKREARRDAELVGPHGEFVHAAI